MEKRTYKSSEWDTGYWDKGRESPGIKGVKGKESPGAFKAPRKADGWTLVTREWRLPAPVECLTIHWLKGMGWDTEWDESGRINACSLKSLG